MPHEEVYNEDTVRKVVMELIKLHGNAYSLCAKENIRAPDLYKYLNGVRSNPPKRVLELLKLEKRTVYIRKDETDDAQH